MNKKRKGNYTPLEYILLLVAALCLTSQNVLKQRFNSKVKGGVFLFGAMIAAVACIFFILINDDWSYRPEQLVPSAGFALAYSTATVFSVLAIRHGSLAKTNLIISCSLLIPSFYGILFLNEEPRVTLIIGIAILIGALIMINYEKDAEKSNAKWFLLVALAFVGNGMCSTVQKIETELFGESGKNVFMIVALAIVSVTLFVIALSSDSERASLKETFKNGWLLALLCGAANGLTNFLAVYLNLRLPASVMFPVISAASIILSFIYSTAVLREKFNTRQKFGFALGVVSIILLNL